MAYKMRIPEAWIKANPNAAKFSFLFNLDGSVGPDCDNRVEDVMLVQYMLHRVLLERPYLGGSRPDSVGDWTGAKNLMKVNGSFDIVTRTLIVVYQMKNYPTKVRILDGKVEPIGTHQTPPQGMLMSLNADLRFATRGPQTDTIPTGLPDYRDIANSNAPPPLKQAVKDFREVVTIAHVSRK